MSTISALAKRVRGARGVTAQRRLLLIAAGALVIALLWSGFTPDLAAGPLGMLAAVVALYGLTFLRDAGIRLFLIPSLAAVTLGVQALVEVVHAPADAALRFALLFGLLALFASTLAESVRAAWIALGVVAIAALASGLFYLPAVLVDFSPVMALGCWLPFMGFAAGGVMGLAARDAQANALQQELERRATSDTITGVSNRAHINLLTQNEFARARRYGEPLSCLMIEIDNHTELLGSWGARGGDTVAQVLTGYCVVVMRHCDSFGRLGAARYLALLPETKGEGAKILASRMCRDTSSLDVAIDGRTLNFSVSIGAAELHALDRNAGDLLRRTNQALEDAIERGRNCAVLAAHPGVLEMDEMALDPGEGPGPGGTVGNP